MTTYFFSLLFLFVLHFKCLENNKMASTLKKLFYLVISKIQSFYNRQRLQKMIFIFYLVLLPLLCLARDVFHITINKYIFAGICFIFSLLLNNTYFLYLFVYTLPFSVGLPDLFIFAIFCSLIILRYFNKFTVKQWILIISVPLFFFILEIVLTFIYRNPNIKESLRLFAVLFFISFAFYNRKLLTYRHILMLLLGYVITYFLITFQVVEVGIWGIKNRAYDWVNFKYLLRAYRFGTSENAVNWVNTGCKTKYPYFSSIIIEQNANKVGLSALLGGASAYFVYPIITNKKDKIFCVVLAILITLFGFWTISRSFILFEMLLGLTIFVFSILHKRTKPIDACIVFFSILLFASLFLLANKDFFNSILDRFFSNDVTTGGGRLTLLSDYFTKMFTSTKYVLFGVGASNLTHEYGIASPPHTNFVQLCCGYGLPITLLFVAFIIFCLIKFQKRIKITNYRFGFYIPMIFGFLFTLTSQIFFPTTILIIFLPAAIIASFNNKESEILVPETIHYPDVFNNISSTNCFAIGKVSFVDEKRKTINIDAKELIDKKQISKLLDDKIKYNPSYVVTSYKDLCENRKISRLLRKFKTSLVLVVCEEDVTVSFKERFKKFFFWDTFVFVYKHEITAEKFEGKKFVNKYKQLIYGESKLNIENVFAYLKLAKERKK